MTSLIMGPSQKKPSFSTVKVIGKMRFNKTEVAALALGQPSHKFEKEGVLFVREKQEGFFKRSEISVERWCRLRGNLLFYFKSRDHWSEPAGVIVVEDCTVRVDNNVVESTFGIVLSFGGGQRQHLATYTEGERESWVSALQLASHKQMRSHLETLRSKLSAKLATAGLDESVQQAITDPVGANVTQLAVGKDTPVIDPCEAPLCEISLSCDNLLCDALGRAPSARIVISAKIHCDHSTYSWHKYGQTEVAEKSSNPVFLKTVQFREMDGISDQTVLKISAYDMRERFTSTSTLLGSATIGVDEMKQSGRTRLKLESPNPDGRTAGFITVNCWTFDSKMPGSTDSTPIHRAVCARLNGATATKDTHKITRHRRSHSLPPAMRHKAKIPTHGSLGLLYTNPIIQTYKFHSGLAGDIIVQELMAESKLSFSFPQQLLSLWICEEKELVHEIAGLGELKAPWHACQMSWLENHLYIINTYSQALENLDNYKGANFRKSSNKVERTFEFVPTNLHLQRLWVENDSLRKHGSYDIYTHGGFTSFGNKSPGLIKMLKELKSPQNDSNAWCSQSDRLQMAEDTLGAVRRVRRDVVDGMRLLMKSAKEKKSDGMFAIVEEMLRKTKCLCSLLDQCLVEEVFTFLEENRVSVRPEKDEFSESVAEFMQRNKLKIDLPLLCRPKMLGPSLQTPCTEFVAKELRTPDVDSMFSPAGVHSSEEFWRTYSAYTSGYQSVDKLSDIDEFEESFRYLSVVDKTKHYYTLCKTGSPIDTPADTPKATPKHDIKPIDMEGIQVDEDEMEYEDEFSQRNDEGICDKDMNDDDDTDNDNDVVAPEESTEDEDESNHDDPITKEEEEKVENVEDTKDKSNDHGLVNESSAGLHYRAGDEPEPIDLTHLNVEAAMMCLASKIRVLCGRADSPTLSSRTFRFKELESSRPGANGSANNFKIPDVPKPTNGEDSIEDWAAELRPSMRKLRQGMDSVCKTAKLTCSVLRLQQRAAAVNLSHGIKYRRDICFSQALTSLVTSLMTRLWCTPQEQVEGDSSFLTLCTRLGPLVSFESLLSLHGEDVTIFNDMIVAVEDLRNVEFTLILVDKRSKIKLRSKNSSGKAGNNHCVPLLEYHTFPLPRVTGSRSSLKVMLPVPDYVYTMLPMEQIKTMTFSVTPVLFNVGINEKATLAGKFGNNGPQEKNNIDNFKTMQEYYRRYKKLGLGQPVHARNKRSSTFINEPDLEDLFSILKNEVNNRKNKNVDILHLAANICRRLQGVRFTNCKSGKDRTGMSATLEQVQILSREYDLAEHEYQKAIDVMRSEGTRRDNTEKNVGQRSYAFNSLQLSTFPYQYRPPVGTYTGRVST